MGVTIGSAVLPLSLALFWNGLSPAGMMAGPIVGTTAALISWLCVASTFPGGLNNFLDNTGFVCTLL